MKKRNLVLGTVLGGVTAAAAGTVVGSYFYKTALQPDMPEIQVKAEDEAWLSEHPAEELATKSFDGLRIFADAVKQGDGSSWVILAHGYTCSSKQMVMFAREFYQMGYSVLMPDARGHGRSEGDYIGMGWHERKDMMHWIEHLCVEYENPAIILYGISMGGATVMMTAGEDLPGNVRAVVEDCGYTSVWDQMKYQLKERYHLPSFPILDITSLITKVKAGYGFREASALRQIKKADRPVLFIHGTEDDFVPTEMVYRLYEAASGPKEKYLVEGAGHGLAVRAAGDEYWKRVRRFLETYGDL